MSHKLGLGRHAAKDDRDYGYLIQAEEPAEIIKRYWYSPGVLNQGGTPMCVAYAGFKYLRSGPVVNDLPMPIHDLYRQCQLIDEWPGTDYDGTSVRALFKCLKRMGMVSEYRWAFDSSTVAAHLLSKGPVIIGSTWKSDMFQPVNGYIQVSGTNEGGHAYLLVGIDKNRVNPDGSIGAVRVVNSWGNDWGDKGRAWMTFHDLHDLILDNGEACVATEIVG